MSKNVNEADLIASVRRHLDLSVSNLEPRVQSRLNEIRSQAMNSQGHSADSEDSLDVLLMSAQACLDDSVQDLEPGINQQLDRIRTMAMRKAVAKNRDIAEASSGSFISRFLSVFKLQQYTVPVGAFATVCVLVTVVSLLYLNPTGTGIPRDESDILLFASSDEIELYENLEFYQWLADNGLPD